MSAFGDVGDDSIVEGAYGDNVPLARLEIPASYNWLPDSYLPSAVLELANLYTAYARGSDGVDAAPNFRDALWMHQLMDGFEISSNHGMRVIVDLGSNSKS